MITVDHIINYSKPRKLGGRSTVISNGKIGISIVGGEMGLYGDFVETFEIAVFDLPNREFVTKHLFPEADDDVIGYVKKKELEEIVNLLFKDNFQVL